MTSFKYISKFHFITDDRSNFSHVEQVEMASAAGVDWVQLRMKDLKDHEMEEVAMQCWEICEGEGTKLIINDHVELAKKVMAYGVHIGKADMSPQDTRVILGENAVVGGTANTLNDILNLSNKGVDYIGLGPFRSTKTKKNLSPVLGLEGFSQINQHCDDAGITTPIIAIGGITLTDVSSLCVTGAHGVAVSSAILDSVNPRRTAREFVKKLNQGMFSYC